MAIPMRAKATQILFAWLSVGVGLVSLISCSAVEDGQRGPIENAPGRQRSIPVSSGAEVPSSSTATAASSASTQPTAGPQDIVVALPCGAGPVRVVGQPRPHALSQKVPDRACSEDEECGDGFCDRGRCAPIWENWYGQRCATACQCGPFVCLEGRCRSCLHHAECVNPHGGNVCGNDGFFTTVPFANVCAALGMRETHMPPEPVRPPPPPTP